MFITAIVFMTGILAYFHDSAVFCAAILTTAGVIAVLKDYLNVKYVLFWIFMFYFGFFSAYFKIHNTDSLVPLAPAKTTLQGQIVTIPGITKSDKTRFFFKAGDAKTLVTISTPCKGEGAECKHSAEGGLNIGDSYEIKGYLKTPFKASNPSQFDYGKYLRNFDTFTVFYATEITPLSKPLTPKWKFLQGLNNLRNRIIATHAQYLKSPNLEILGGIVFGDDAVAPPGYIKSSFVNSGLLHILAASGMNVAFIFGFWFFILRRLRVPYKVINITGMGLVVLYTLMTGLGPSVIRAALMLLFMLAGKLIDRTAHSVSLLAFVAMLMLVYNPAFINDVGFQLSFRVTFGILATGGAVFDYLERYESVKRLPDWLVGGMLIPVIAQIWVAPVQMFYFNTFSTYSVFANVAGMVFLSIISFGGFVTSILAIFTPFTEPLCHGIDFILNYFITILVWISEFFSNLPHSLLTTTHPCVLQILMYYAVVLIITLMFRIGFNKKLAAIVAGIIVLLALSTINIPNKNLEIIAFNVQNADAFLIKTPQNKYFFIDTGKPSQTEVILLKYLKDRHIMDIEGMIITHSDTDHSGGAEALIKTLNVKGINTEYAEKDLKITNRKAGLKTGNENSIITLLSYKDFDMLFMGDAGVKAFERVKAEIPSNVEVLKVGHHGGSRVVSAKMLKHLKNDVSEISVGQNNYGHPNRKTLDILKNTDIYRTDKHNSVKIVTDGKIYKVLTYDTAKRKYITAAQHKTR
jgi:competence protein ComEC